MLGDDKYVADKQYDWDGHYRVSQLIAKSALVVS
jgi:hypothetical protein